MAAAWWRPWLTLSRHQPTPPPPPAAHRTSLSLRFHTNGVLAPASPRRSATTPAAVLGEGCGGCRAAGGGGTGFKSCLCAGNPVRGAGVCWCWRWRVVGGPARKAPRKQVLPRASALHQHLAHPPRPVSRGAAPLPARPMPTCNPPRWPALRSAAVERRCAQGVCPAPGERRRLTQPPTLHLHLCKARKAPGRGRSALHRVPRKKVQRAARPGSTVGVGTGVGRWGLGGSVSQNGLPCHWISCSSPNLSWCCRLFYGVNGTLLGGAAGAVQVPRHDQVLTPPSLRRPGGGDPSLGRAAGPVGPIVRGDNGPPPAAVTAHVMGHCLQKFSKLCLVGLYRIESSRYVTLPPDKRLPKFVPATRASRGTVRG